MAEKQGVPSGQAPRSTRFAGLFPPDMPISGVSKAVEFLAEGVGVETTPEGVGFSGNVPFYESAKKGIAAVADDPMGVLGAVGQAVSGMIEEQAQASSIRPGQMVREKDGTLRQVTSDELSSALDPTLGGTFAAPLVARGAMGGLEGLMPQPGVVSSGGTRAVSNVTLPGHGTKNTVVDLGVRFESEHPAFKNMSASYVEPSDPVGAVRAHNELIQDQIEKLQVAKKFMDPSRQQTFDDQIQELFDQRISLYDTQEAQKEIGQIQRYVQTDNRTGTDTLGIIRVTAPQDDILRASGGKNAGPVDIGHDPLYTGGEGGLTPQDISRRKAAIDAEMYSLRAAIEDDDIVSGVPKNLDLDSDEGQVFLFEKALATVKQKELKGELDYTGPKNAPIGFARFADIDLDGERYMRLTEIQSDLFKETRASKKGEPVRDYKSNVWDGGEELPELYPNMKKDDKPLSSAVLKASVATAIQRGSKGIVLPNSATSDAGVRYSDSNVKKLLNKTVKDLGEGFSYRKVEVPSTTSVKFDDIGNVRDAIKKGNQQTITEHYVLEWSGISEVPDELKFATGGLVSLPPRTGDGIVGMIRKYRREGLMD
jgi:hypothetical protein